MWIQTRWLENTYGSLGSTMCSLMARNTHMHEFTHTHNGLPTRVFPVKETWCRHIEGREQMKSNKWHVKRAVIRSCHNTLTHFSTLFHVRQWAMSQQKHPGQCLSVDIYHLVLHTSMGRLGHRALTSRFSGKIVIPPFKGAQQHLCWLGRCWPFKHVAAKHYINP